MQTYKRIIEIESKSYNDLMSWSGHAGVSIRPARSQMGASPIEGEFVITGPAHERRRVDRIVELFDPAYGGCAYWRQAVRGAA